METKLVEIEGQEVEFIKYKTRWVFPKITYYTYGLDNPIAFILLCLPREDEEEEDLEYYCTVTINLPDRERSAGCQFIDTNNHGNYIINWLEENDFGKRTGKMAQSGFCSYPEFNFYKGENFMKYKEINEKLFNTD